jgi:hypothetical protein
VERTVKEYEDEWRVLCARAAVEQDPAELLRLVERINELLETKRRRLVEKRSIESSGGVSE